MLIFVVLGALNTTLPLLADISPVLMKLPEEEYRLTARPLITACGVAEPGAVILLTVPPL